MARYFFDFHDAQFSTRDHDGTECADRDAVSSEALRALCEIAADHPERYAGTKLRVAVRDATDRPVLTASINLMTAWHVDDARIGEARSEAA